MQKFVVIALLLVAALTTACAAVVPDTGDTANQFLSAQNQMPPPPNGYQTVDADSIQSALSAAATAANLSAANVFGAAAVNRIDALVSCYRDVGAVDVKAYFSIMEAGGGVAVVINNDRIANNLVQCVTEALGRDRGARALDSAFQPCVKGGSFQAKEGDVTNTFSYMYVGSTPNLCNAFQAHFTSKGG